MLRAWRLVTGAKINQIGLSNLCHKGASETVGAPSGPFPSLRYHPGGMQCSEHHACHSLLVLVAISTLLAALGS